MYKQVDKYLNLVRLEDEVLEFWERNTIFRKLREKNSGGKPWSFLDGPITANNPMGVHHAWGRTLKDLFQRFHAMHGHELRYQNGFDCQGLWVEVEVEKEHGFKSKHDILEYGIENFVRDCKERVLTYAARQTEQSIRLGYWMEWDEPAALLRMRDALHEGRDRLTVSTPGGETLTDTPEQLVAHLGSPDHGGSYFTFSNANNYAIWDFLKRCHHEGFVYRGTDVMPWCPRCGTGLSQMEVSEGRKITRHASLFVRFPLVDREHEAFLVWTTTPWTLTSNVAVAVNPGMTYLKIRQGDWVYYVGKDNFNASRIQNLEAEGKRETVKLPSLVQLLKGQGGEAEILEELSGEALLGLSYEGPFDDLPAQNSRGGLSPFSDGNADDAPSSVQCHRAIAWKDISGDEGTGIVHIAPGCGTEDYLLGRENGLVDISPLTENGDFIDGFGEFTGENVARVTEQVITVLKERGKLVGREQYPHVYPHCWRCKTELVFRLVDGWYIRMDWRDRIQKIVPGVRWIPADGEARERDWLNNMGDWLISKKRFWGLALPIWVCDACNWFTVIGGEQELKEKAVDGLDKLKDHSPHRPYIDQVKIRCEQCGGTAHRIEDVGNPWLDAGIVPFSTMRHYEDKEYWSRWFPAQLVIECFPGQFRNWFYSLLAMSALIDGRAPFHTLLGHALVRDERGEEMHKSTGNAISFDEAAQVFGAETMRYLYASHNPAINLNFPDLKHESGGTHPDVEVRRKLLTLWNCYGFFISYAQVDNWVPLHERLPAERRSELDRWILSRLQGLITAADTHFRDYSVHRFMAHLEHFNDELSNWYLRRSRRRFWKSGMDEDKRAAFETLFEVLCTVIRLIAPVLPFFSEHIYQNLVRSVISDASESVHLTRYPRADAALADAALEQQVNTVIRIKNAGLNARNQSRIKIRQPLQRLVVKPRDEAERTVLSNPMLVGQILDECNVKELELIADAKDRVRMRAELNFKSLGPKLGKRMQEVKEFLEHANISEISKTFAMDRTYRFNLADGTGVELTSDDLGLVFDAGNDAVVLEDAGTIVILETVITPGLMREGLARDFNRQVQNLRKKENLELTGRIKVQYMASDLVAEAVEEHLDHLRNETLANEIVRVNELKGGEVVKVGKEKLELVVEKCN